MGKNRSRKRTPRASKPVPVSPPANPLPAMPADNPPPPSPPPLPPAIPAANPPAAQESPLSATPSTLHSRVRTTTTDSTPLNHTSSFPSTGTRAQQQLKGLMKEELGWATYEENDFMTKWFPVMSNPLVKHVLSGLEAAKLSHDNLYFQGHPFDGSKSHDPWPTSKAEPSYYEPFVWLLNTVSALAKKTKAGSKTPVPESIKLHRHLQFYAHGQEMKEGLGNSHPLKPDGIGVHGSIPKWGKVSWRDVEVVIEVKEDWPELIAQAATYARCLFAARETRHFALVIAFNHRTSDIRFCFFRRDGVWASPALNLHQAHGFEAFVRSVVGILSWNTLELAGMDMERSEGRFFIAGQCLDIVDVFCNRQCVRGRATRVYKIRTTQGATKTKTEQGPSVDSSTVSNEAVPTPVEQLTIQYNLRSRAQPPSARSDAASSPLSGASNRQVSLIDVMNSQGLSPHSVESGGRPLPLADTTIPRWYFQSRTKDWEKFRLGTVSPSESDGLANGGSRVGGLIRYRTLHPPQCLELKARKYVIIKEAWLAKSHANEGRMFKEVKGRFGVPRLLSSRRVGDDYIAPRAKFWALWHKEPPKTLFEQRRLHRTIYLTEGRPLVELDSPRKLVEAILHAMLGHWVLFEAGWLHRDVSSSNVMAIEAEERPAVQDFAVSREITQCTGMIVDGDLAIEWNNEGRSRADHRSGTLPFMATRLLKEWQTMDKSAPKFTHTALDDLESFLWVLFWVTLERQHTQKGRLAQPELDWWSKLNSHNIGLQSTKNDLITNLELFDGVLVGPIKRVTPLLLTWGKLSRTALKEIITVTPDGLTFDMQKKWYEKYLDAGFTFLKGALDSWED